MAFKPSNLQSTAAALIATAAALEGNALAGITIAVEGTDEPIDAKVEAALRTQGQVLAIAFPDFARRSSGPPGASILTAFLPVYLFVNPTQNRADGGLDRDPMLVIEALWTAIAGRPASRGPAHFEPSAQPLERITDQAGALIYTLEFEAPVTITNPQP